MEVGHIFMCASLVLTLLNTQVQSYSNNDVKSLLKKLFKTDSYNKKIRPSTDFSQQIEVTISLNLIALNEIDDVKGKVMSTAYLEVTWTDEYLKWSSASFNGVEEIYIPQKDIWRPDFSLQNGFTKLRELGDENSLTIVSMTGEVLWKPYEIFESKCLIDILYFPFDKQSCQLIFGTWIISLAHVDVNLGDEKNINLDEYQEDDEWVILSTSAVATESKSEGAKVIYTINLKRNSRYYLLNIIVPVFFLSILVTFTFVIPVESGEKMGYTMTVFLSFAVFLTIISSSLPVSSDPSIMSMYLVFLLTIGTLIVMITAIEIRLHNRDPSHVINKSYVVLFRMTAWLRCQNCHTKKNKTTVSVITKDLGDAPTEKGICDMKPRNDSCEKDICWADVTEAIDFLCFLTFFFIIIFVTTAMLSFAYVSSL